MTGTDNSFLDVKVDLRLAWLDKSGLSTVRVLDAYGGDGMIWSSIREQRPDVKVIRTAIESVKGKGDPTSTLYGDNMRFLPTMELASFDVIDLDAYNVPCAQVATVAERAPDKPVFVTLCHLPLGVVPDVVLEKADIPVEWVRAAPGLFTPMLFELWDNFLASLGYTVSDRVQVDKSDLGVSGAGAMRVMYEHLTPFA